MVSRILVPRDASEHAGQALEQYPEADVTVLHVVGVPSMMMGEATGLALDDDLTSSPP